MKDWFKLRGTLSGQSSIILTVTGFLITLILWWILAELFSRQRPVYAGQQEKETAMFVDSINSSSAKQNTDTGASEVLGYEKVYPLLPRPDKTLKAFKPLFSEDKLISNTLHSAWLNMQGYFWAILISLPMGMLLSLFPIFRTMFSRQIDALRYLPLSALTGLFIIWFGLGDAMKIAFLAVGILVYLIPVVMQRINEVDDTLVQTGDTMGASGWQKIKKVFFPASISSLMDDIRVLTAISWTYIIIAELLNKQKGIGSLIYTKARLGQTDRVFAILIVITLIGLFQDQFFKLIDRIINPHKYYKSKLHGMQDANIGLYALIAAIVLGIVSGWTNLELIKYASWVLAVTGLVFIGTGFFKINNEAAK